MSPAQGATSPAFLSGRVLGVNGRPAVGLQVSAQVNTRPSSALQIESGVLNPNPFGTVGELAVGPTSGATPYGTDFFGLFATGSYTAPSDGNYTFKLRSDDGAVLGLSTPANAVFLLANDGVHGTTERSGTVFLNGGTTYSVAVHYFEYDQIAEFRLFVDPPGSVGFIPFAPQSGFNIRVYDLSRSSRTATVGADGSYAINFPVVDPLSLPPTLPIVGSVSPVTPDTFSPLIRNFSSTTDSVNGLDFIILSSPPTISAAANYALAEDTDGLVTFTVNDLQSSLFDLTLTVTSSNQTLVPDSAFTVTSSSGDARFVRFTPRLNAAGTTLLTATVRDTEGKSASRIVLVTVTNANDRPIAGSKYALAFDGVNDEVIAPALVITNRSFTIEAWARRDAANRWDVLAWQGTNMPNQGLNFGFRDNNKFTFAFWSNDLDAPTPTTDTNWHHWAGTYDASNGLRRLYLDGLLVVQDVTTNAFRGVGSFLIGRRPDVGFFKGALDEVRVWSVARSQVEIATKRFEPLVGNETALLAYWRLDEAGTIFATDSSHQGKDGALTYPNGPVWVAAAPGFGNRLVPEDSPGTPIFLPGFDVDSAITYQILSVSTGAVSQLSGQVTNLLFNPVSYTPPANYTGPATITYLVTDGALTDTNTFQLTVQAMNDPPILSLIADQVMLEDGVLDPVSFQVSDPDNDADTLQVTASSGDPTLIPASGIALGGSGTNRTFTLTPTPGESGTLEITLTAYDGFLSTERRFIVRVEPRPAYKIFDLGALPNRPVAFGAALNDVGLVLGDAAENAQGDSRRAFVFQGVESGGSLTEVGTLAGLTSAGTALNNLNHIVGTSLDALGQSRAFLRSGGSGTALRELGTLLGGATSFGTALNDNGLAAGYGPNVAGKNRAFLWTNGPLRELGPLGSHADASQAFGINLSNLVVGVSFDVGGLGQATLWSGTTTNALGFLPGGNHSVGYALNRFGLVVGSGNTTNGTELVQRAFLWQGGAMIDLGTLPGGVSSEARALNNFGQIAGFATVSNETRATLYSAGQLYDLNNVVPEEDQLVWRLTRADGINARGEIVGSGTLNGVPRGFLAIPANVIGRKVTRPAGSVAGVPPQIELLQSQPGDTAQNAFHFSLAAGKLYAIRPVTARVKWPTSTNPLDTNAPPISVLHVNVWPRTPQVHIAAAPVETQPAVPGFAHAFQSLLHTTSPGANVDGGSKVFNATQPGYSVLYYLQNEGQSVNPQTQPPYFEVARTFFWNDPRVLPANVDNVVVDIGAVVTSSFHRDHPGRNGWMHFEKAFYDGAGTERAYDRATRTGPILPVNRDTASASDDFVVVWYATNAINVSWAYQPVRYNPIWPMGARQLVIASTFGSGELDFFTYGFAVRVYNQPNTNLAGFNPNEEHALITAANGGTGQALFALRDDLNRFNNFSEPYALLKYRDPLFDEWRIEPFRVVPTNAQYQFQYSGVAGNEIAPLYPLSLLTLCEQSHGVSGPYWEDYHGKLYARAAGYSMDLTAQIVARWWYPLQPGFFYDLDGNGSNDVAQGTSLGLLEKRQVANPNQLPVDVSYLIRWPDVPVLQIGETVLRRKRGLPDVLNFASAEIIWDSSNPTIDLTGTNLLASAVRLFDPVGTRTLRVADVAGLAQSSAAFEIPPVIRTSLRNGKIRFDDLPPDIGERLAYDPLNKWFLFSGVFDELRTAGEPFYLLNILTARERDRIQELDGPTGGSTDWDKIFTALYDLTRNPNRIDVQPRDGQPDPALRVGFMTNAAGVAVLEKLPETKALTAAIGDAPPAAPLPGNAMSFDGVDDVVNGGEAVDLAATSFALEFWVKRAGAGEHFIVSQGAATPFAGLEVGFRADGRFVFSFSETGGDTPLVTTTTYNDTDWHHWAATFNATTRERVIYRDGIALVSDTAASSYIGSGTFMIGRGLSGGFFNGQLDDVRVWNQPRTAFTVAKDRSKRLVGNEGGLLRYFRFDETLGVTAIDSSDFTGHATFIGATRVASTAPTGIPPRYVTVAENSRADLQLPVSLHVIRIDDGPFTGQLNDIAPPNVFSEKISIRHSSDFGAEPERLTFEWWYRPDNGDVDPTDLPIVDPVSGDVLDPRGWLLFSGFTPPDGRGVNYVTLGDGGQSSLLTLGDNWFVMRYRGFNVNGAVPWSDWAGDPAAGPEPRAKLVEGWIKRVIRGLNPFDQRVADFHTTAANTFATMLIQAGGRYEGDVAFNPEANAINSIGLIEAYETVRRRGQSLSIDGTPAVNFDAANNALLLVSGKIADLYVLLGNEAYADASDPTIGFTTGSGHYGSAASSIFAFQNQLPSLLDEELSLLRGRDNRNAGVGAIPVYNRLFWNFTLGEGEIAYQQAYAVKDFNVDGFIDEKDARLMYPQGHGDAWGHYLTAITKYYELLRHENFTWVPRSESVLINGVAVEVDFLDERKFAVAAAARARSGGEIVNLTYRLNYVDDPAGQWQGYKDTDIDRAWGVTEWARRAAQGAIFDWMTANAILPPTDPNPNHTGIAKIDRTTVLELGQVASEVAGIQSRMDQADTGLNPVGVAKGAIPFDINPTAIERGYFFQGASHFDQIRDRAVKALNNAVKGWDEANKFTQALRHNQDDADGFIADVRDQELEYRNKLIEIFGYPFAGDIGPGKTFPSGYDGPDLYHYMYVKTAEISGENAPPAAEFKAFFRPMNDGSGNFFYPETDRVYDPNTLETSILEVRYPQVQGSYTFSSPSEWGERRAPGDLQDGLSDVVQNDVKLKKALFEYNALILDIEDAITLLEAHYDLQANEIELLSGKAATIATLNSAKLAFKTTQKTLKRMAALIKGLSDSKVNGLPLVVGLASDPSFALRLILGELKIAGEQTFETAADGAELAESAVDLAKESVSLAIDIKLTTLKTEFDVLSRVKDIEVKLREEPAKRLEVFNQREVLVQSLGKYRASLAEGERLLQQLVLFRKRTAAQTSEQRYQDMTFRLFRNDALQKYRASFDLAAKFVYLAANAYDYEVNLGGNDARAATDFLTDIIRQRSLGQVVAGEPVVGLKGLADPLARLTANFDVLKPQFGLNNSQVQDARFSLRSELFRVGGDVEGGARWREVLTKARVANLWDVPEFRRYCRPFAQESGGAQPALVLRFPTTVTFGLNYFGWPLGPGDSAYDPSRFTTKILRAGVWFSGADGSQIAATPRVYLVPVGMDVMRSPRGDTLATREWRVLDQVIPEPFPIGASSLQDPAFNPTFDSIAGNFTQIRRYSSFPAYHDSGAYSEAQTTSDSRLVGRSVWNTEWMLIIPGGTLLNDPKAGLDTFINTVSDIKIYFATYSYSGL